VAAGFSFGDVIRKRRKEKHLSQTALGKAAQAIQLGKGKKPINKSTVSKVENDPYSSEFGTILRLLHVLNLSLSELERRADPPFVNKPLGERQGPATKGRQDRAQSA